MMFDAWLNMLFLAILQGITEFIPISSSAHLVLAQHWLGIAAPGILLELVLHAGSLISIVVFFRRRLTGLLRSFFTTGGEGRRYAAWIVLGSIPAGAIGLLFHEPLARRFDAPAATGFFLIVTGLILLSSRLRPRRDARPLSAWIGLTVGAAQALAILPGISRSGATITTARRLGLSPKDAAEFSFVLSIPVLCGTTLLMLRDLHTASESGWSLPLLLFGMIVSAVTGYFALSILIRVLKSGWFWAFGIYCLVAGIAALIYFSG